MAINGRGEPSPVGDGLTDEIMRGEVGSPKVPPSIRIAETFVSRQGEGKLTGTESFFIRTSGCNLRCWFCDTPYASWNPEGDRQSVRGLVETAIASGTRHVVLTGGEPLLPIAAETLVRELRAAGLHVTIETAGTVLRDVTADLLSISPKLAGSGPQGDQADGKLGQRHEATRWRPDVIRALIAQSLDHQLKFVVDTPEDFDAAAQAANELEAAPQSVWIMPQGIDAAGLDAKAAWLTPRCERHGFRYCDRMHVRWYGNRRGT
jgi:7-carboxy-7-deazaguanine synthase